MEPETFPPPQQLALAHSGKVVRPLLASFFELDGKFAKFVSQASEPMLAQMRIAWWRDQLTKPVEDRPQGDQLLAELSRSWAGEEFALSCLADGWESLLAEPPLPEDAARDFATGRAACFAAIARLSDNADAADAIYKAGFRWASADLISRLSDAEERRFVLEQVVVAERPDSRIPYQLRSLKILASLAERSISRGGGPLINDRLDILTVARIGLFGS